MRNATSILNQRPVFASAVLTFVFMLGLAPNAHAQQRCSNASLRGGYGFHSSATVVPAGTPRTVIAVFTFDGRGTYAGTVTLNDNGSIIQFPDTGTYVVNPDCTGTLFEASGLGSSQVVVVEGGNEFYQMRVEPSSIVLYATAKKLFPAKEDPEKIH
jgi:hypothetical protein